MYSRSHTYCGGGESESLIQARHLSYDLWLKLPDQTYISELFCTLKEKKRPLDNQVLDNKQNFLRQVALIIAAIAGVLLIALIVIFQIQRTDPYVQDVLALAGNPMQGSAIFQMNCAGCHGVLADGRIGPSLLEVSSRKSKVSIIYQVTSGQTPPMPQFQPSPQEMADLLAYLATL